MKIEEAKERMKDLIHTCDIGIEKHGTYDDLFQKDKEAIETVLQELENSISKDKIRERLKDLEKQYKTALEENSTKAFILKCQIEILIEILGVGD